MNYYNPEDFIVELNVDLTTVKKVLDSIPIEGYHPQRWYTPQGGYYETKEFTSLCYLASVDEPLGREVHRLTQAVITEYMTRVPDPDLFNLSRCGAGKVTKYSQGCSMKRHVDHIKDLVSDQGNGGIPTLSIIFQPEGNYEGGNLIVRDRVFSQGSDKAVMFPSNILYPHEVTEITKGERTSITVWAW